MIGANVACAGSQRFTVIGANVACAGSQRSNVIGANVACAGSQRSNVIGANVACAGSQRLNVIGANVACAGSQTVEYDWCKRYMCWIITLRLRRRRPASEVRDVANHEVRWAYNVRHGREHFPSCMHHNRKTLNNEPESPNPIP